MLIHYTAILPSCQDGVYLLDDPMTATGHALVGAAIAAKVPDWRISIPLCLISHFLGDALPHWDTGFYWRQKGMRKVFFDTLVDIFGGYFLVAAIFLFYLH